MAHTFLNAGHKRKKQVYGWFIEVIRDRSTLNQKYIRSKQLLLMNKPNESIQMFENLLTDIINRNPDNIGLVIGYDIDNFGFARVLRDLYNGTVLPRVPIQIRQVKKTQIDKVEIEDFVKPAKKRKIKTVFGINKKGDRVKANIETLFIKKTKSSNLILRDTKTGRFLKQTRSFRKRLKKAKGKET